MDLGIININILLFNTNIYYNCKKVFRRPLLKYASTIESPFSS